MEQSRLSRSLFELTLRRKISKATGLQGNFRQAMKHETWDPAANRITLFPTNPFNIIWQGIAMLEVGGACHGRITYYYVHTGGPLDWYEPFWGTAYRVAFCWELLQLPFFTKGHVRNRRRLPFFGDPWVVLDSEKCVYIYIYLYIFIYIYTIHMNICKVAHHLDPRS